MSTAIGWIERQSASGIPIRSYLTESTPAESRAALRQTPAMIDFIEKLVGPYPFDGYGAVMVDDPELYLRARDAGDVDLPEWQRR